MLRNSPKVIKPDSGVGAQSRGEGPLSAGRQDRSTRATHLIFQLRFYINLSGSGKGKGRGQGTGERGGEGRGGEGRKEKRKKEEREEKGRRKSSFKFVGVEGLFKFPSWTV